ncbi:MAG: hypothetical protein RDV41_00120 [Planctomycetota bacterium]|nr:hypothetical protein [Planctomycetota bacterium]
MLAEVTKVRQIPGEPERRWFSDDLYDLFVWFSKEGTIVGFQLCYDKGHKEKALTWTSDRGFSHLKVDSGDVGWSRMTPILVPDGVFDTGRVLAEFKRVSRNIEAGIADFVIARLGEYGGTGGAAESETERA